MDFHAFTSQGSGHICTVHCQPDDKSPLQIISAEQLAYYQRIERAYLELERGLCTLVANTSQG